MATPKSKESKKKMRRWQYLVHVTKDGKKGTFQPPAITIGSSHDAQKAAASIQKDMETLPQFEGATVKVEPVGFETVSQTTLNQINGLSDEVKLITIALKLAVTDLVNTQATDGVVEHDKVDQLVREKIGVYAKAARQQMLEEQAKAMGGELVAPASEVEGLPENFVAPEPPAGTADAPEGVEAQVEDVLAPEAEAIA